ncbi:AAA domain-containing protein [Sphingobacterium hungaricum]
MALNYFENLLVLLKQEQDYDREQHSQLLMHSNLNERRAQGVSWFPIQITNTEIGRGDYLSVSLLRTNNQEEQHRFRFGMPVSLFSNHNPGEDRLNGTIAFVNRESMRIAFRVDELPDWTRRGKLGVDLLFDENSYREMELALNTAMLLAKNPQEGKLVRQFIGLESINYRPATTFSYQNESLNPSQCLAVENMLSENSLTILHGPPGTGKTTTLVKGIQALLKNKKQQLLVVAPSNTAVDLLTEQLDQVGVSVVRIGNPVKVSDHLQALTLDGQVDQHRSNKEVKALEKQMRAYTDMAHKYKRNFGKAEREQRKALFNEAHKIRKEIDQIQNFLMNDVLGKAQVITATLVGANHAVIRDRSYGAVIIDEAAQALEPACWIPILKGDKIILAGDHCQLPPTVKSIKGGREGLYNTLFEKLIALYPEAVSMLQVQYRMNSQIMHHSSKLLYINLLQADASVADRRLIEDHQPISFIDTAGAGFEEIELDGAISNEDEANFLHRHLQDFVGKLDQLYTLEEFPTIGIIAPYRKQIAYLKTNLEQDEQLKKYGKLIQINTIDSFQGQEKDIIYISLTRSNENQNIGFLSDVRRMNVAMTRAKKKLLVIGDSATVGQHDFYREFLSYIDELDAYHSIWEYDFAVVG